MDTKEEYFYECGLQSVSDDEKYLLLSMFDGRMHCVFCMRIKLNSDLNEHDMIELSMT